MCPSPCCRPWPTCRKTRSSGASRQLQAAEFLYESSLLPEREYTFKHALTQEVAYRGLLQDRRRAIHAKLVGTLERLGGDRSTEQIAQLAHHAFRAEAWDKAITYLRQAGEKATERSAYAEAVARFEQALEALDTFPRAANGSRRRSTFGSAFTVRIPSASSNAPSRISARPNPRPRPWAIKRGSGSYRPI